MSWSQPSQSQSNTRRPVRWGLIAGLGTLFVLLIIGVRWVVNQQQTVPYVEGDSCPVGEPSLMPFINAVAQSSSPDFGLLPQLDNKPKPVCVERTKYLAFRDTGVGTPNGQLGLQILVNHYAQGNPVAVPMLQTAFMNVVRAESADGMENALLGWIILPSKLQMLPATATIGPEQVNIVPAVMVIVSPTVYPWPTLPADAGGGNEPANMSIPSMAAPTDSPYYCPASGVAVQSVSFDAVSSLHSYADTMTHLDVLHPSTDKTVMTGMPVMPGGGFTMCVHELTGMPPTNNLDGLGASWAQDVGNLQAWFASPCAGADSGGISSCGGGIVAKKIAGIYWYPLRVPDNGVTTPAGITKDTTPVRIESQVWSMGSWLLQTWNYGPNFGYDVLIDDGKDFVITFVTQDGVGRNVNLAPIRDHWNGSADNIVFGSCSSMPSGVPNYVVSLDICISQFQ